MLLKTRPTSAFTRIAKGCSHAVGRPLTFVVALLLVIVWAVTGPWFDYSNAWQLTINTGTTIITFLMVFLIHAQQNRDSEAIQIKLDELIRVLDGAHNELIDLEDLEEEDLMRLHARYLRLAQFARHKAEEAPKGDSKGDSKSDGRGVGPAKKHANSRRRRRFPDARRDRGQRRGTPGLDDDPKRLP